MRMEIDFINDWKKDMFIKNYRVIEIAVQSVHLTTIVQHTLIFAVFGFGIRIYWKSSLL
jgi:hypothetical protein